MVLTDLQKNFDTNNEKLLLQKLKAIKFLEQTIYNGLDPYLWKLKTNSLTAGPILLLISVNDMPQAVKSSLFLHVSDTYVPAMDSSL